MAEIIYSIIITTIITLLVTPVMIKGLIRLKTGQNIRQDGPSTHLVKAGTPSMGGLIFIAVTVVMFLVIGRERFFNPESLLVVASFVLFSVIGFMDDYLKIVKKQNEGLKSKEKLILQLIFGTIIGVAALYIVGSDIRIPFSKTIIDLKWFYVPFITIFFTATTNGTNLTDGLDGLLTSVSILIVTFFGAVCLGFLSYHLAIFCAILAGALLGYLRVNSFPASVFMGDTGSMAIGGAIGAVAIVLKLELIILIVGAVYVVEAASVIIQVASCKTRNKRVFKMAPIHHHFEALGWHENKVVSVFSIATVLLCLVGYLAII